MKIDIEVSSPISRSVRAAQVSSMFDVPAQDRAHLQWHGDLPIEDREWSIGLIVGPSGCGKSTILDRMFGAPAAFAWTSASVIDDFDPNFSVEAVAAICQAVGFNTIPAWLRPYAVLSNGERFRVDLARRLLEGGDLIACDEFTSVVDRQVARIGAHAAQKYIRKGAHRFVAATCHYDLEEWLQPNWIFEPATMTFRWRERSPRPAIHCSIHRAPYHAWQGFARFHYLTAELNKIAKCYVLCVDDVPAAFAAVLHRPHPRVRDVVGMTRLVTLPDHQGLGLAFALADRVASAYKARGKRYHAYPAHPSLMRSFDRSPNWKLIREPGFKNSNIIPSYSNVDVQTFGGRPCAVFAYCGPEMQDHTTAELLIA